jgi:CheY-like chemotaxis protein
MIMEFHRSSFVKALHDALFYLYDPYELKRSPLQSYLAPQLAERGIDLKQGLIESINALTPDESIPYDTKAWKIYEALNYYFVEQVSQREAAKTLLISLRTFQRLLPEAIDVLAERIASDYQIVFSEKENKPEDHETAAESQRERNDTWVKETTALKSKKPSVGIDIGKMLKEISQILQPILQDGEKSVSIQIPEENWQAAGEVTILRQAVLTAVSFFNQPGKKFKISIFTEQKGKQGVLQIQGQRGDEVIENTETAVPVDTSKVLADLMGILQGSVAFQRTSPGGLLILLKVPVLRQYKIAVVDDNADAIRLVEKILPSGNFFVIGIQDPEQVIPLIERERPSLILMDVMLPNIDGWMLLSQIKSSPNLSNIPVIISTVLPHEDLSLSLGANGFLRKPFTQQELLQALEAHVLKKPM